MESGRKGDRKAIGLLVKLQHASVERFAEEYATNLSPGGMFIRSKAPQPVGSLVKFEVQIAGGIRVMKGMATVRWIRQAGDPEGAPGMGVQFDKLDDATRALVDRMLAAAGKSESSSSDDEGAAADLQAHAAALEAELLASHGAPRADPRGALPSIAPLPALAPLPPVAPSIKPEPNGAARPLEAAPFPLPGDELFVALELEPPPAADELEVPIELEVASPDKPDDAIDLSFADLVADTPAPVVESPSALDDALFAEADPSPMSELPGGLELSTPPSFPPAPVAQSEEDAAGLELSAWADAAPETPPAPPPSPAAPVAKPPVPPAFAAVPTSPMPEVRRKAPPAAPLPTPVLARPPEVVAPRAPQSGDELVFLKPPEKIDPTGPVIGIDLGTTNSCVGVLQAGKPVILRSKQGYNTLPSIVSLTANGKLLIAHPARNQMVLNPQRTVYGAKRLVGRAFDSPTVSQVRERFHYEICPDAKGRAAVRLGDNIISLEEVQGLVLRECKEMAEQGLGRPVSRAVVTVPAYYSEPQREAVRKAGAMAGLKIERILNEPTAAALAFGLNRELNKKVLVYDLGGGTFDATVLKIEKNVFEVLGTGGDIFLGGLDFDNAIVDVLLEKFQTQEKIAFSGDSIALSRVTEVAEKAKMALSERTTFEVHLPTLMMDSSGKPRELRCTLTRDELNATAMPLIERTLDVVRDVLLDAKLKAKDVDEIILVGGQSRMPLVREKLKELFGKAAHASVNADEAVALGAALYSGSVDKVSSVVLIDVLPMTIGIGMPGGGYKRVLERNTALPAQRSFSIPTGRDNEQTIEFSVFQGEDGNIAGNDYLGTVRIEGLPKAPAGLVKVAVTLRLDAECVLHVEASDLATRRTVKSTLATRYTTEDVQKVLGISPAKVEQAQAQRAEELKGRSGRFWGFLKKVVGR